MQRHAPVMVADRLPPVNPNGTASLSPTTTRTCSNGTPNSSAAIWARVVWWLWPWGIWPVNTNSGAVLVQPHAHLFIAHPAAATPL